MNSGNRGRRGARAEDLLATLTGTEAALVVNNCAAAALLVLTVLAREGETIVSRGELVEIGGDFRVPEVMAQSGTRMVEVGTTNRTKLADYQKAITADTRLIMRVHTSNYRIVGFTKAPTLKELATLAHESGLLLYEDAGSGALIDFTQFGITGEPIIRESFAAGVDVISFSGDKLLGGPQAGLLVGRHEVIERMRKHSLYRALRADKLRIAALEATLDAYARNATTNELPTHQMISMTFDDLKSRVTNFIEQVKDRKRQTSTSKSSTANRPSAAALHQLRVCGHRWFRSLTRSSRQIKSKNNFANPTRRSLPVSKMIACFSICELSRPRTKRPWHPPSFLSTHSCSSLGTHTYACCRHQDATEIT